MNTTTIEPTTDAQKEAQKLAFAYHGFLRGVQAKDDFDLWYYGDKLLQAQDAIGFEMVNRKLVEDISRAAGIALDEARATKPILAPIGID